MRLIYELLIITSLILCYNVAAEAANIYVDDTAGGNNDGTSWTNAYTDLQTALDAYTNEDIWVAAGTYFPTKDPFGNASPTDPRDKTFFLPDGIKIYGGFVGTETLLSERDIPSNVSTLSGDIGTAANNADNSYHVVFASADASTGIGVTVDGFFITAGNANGLGEILVNGHGAYREAGSGIHIVYGANTLTNNTIHNNSAISGAGIWIAFSTNTLTNNIIHSNSSNDVAGGIYTDYGTNTFVNNTIYNNSANSVGGGIGATGTNTFVNNTIYNNSAEEGGGIFAFDGTITLTNNTIYNNSANSAGGGIVVYFATITLTNNIFWDNKKGTDNNVAGAGIENGGSTLTVEYCLTQENSTYSTGTGIINNQDPLFVNAADPDGADNIAGTVDDGLALQNCSPVINMGTTTSPTIPMDILGNDRVGAYDMGAYENQSPESINENGGLAMGDATVNLSQAVNTYYVNDCSSLLVRVEQSGASPITGSVISKIWFDATVSQAGQPYVQRHLEITPTANAVTATGTVTLYFIQAEFNAFNADPTSTLNLPANGSDAAGIANLKITKFPGVSGDGSGNPGSYSGTPILIDPADANIVWNAIMERWEVTFDVTGFSGFFVHTGNTPLPVEMTYFKAEKQEKTALLTWATASEENNKGFLVERSQNDVDFEPISFVEGASNTIETQEYRFIDETPFMGINYYRLTQIDIDGTESLSKVRQVIFKGKTSYYLYPNPATEKSKVKLDMNTDFKGTMTIEMISVEGKQISIQQQEITEGFNSLSLDVSALAEGLYFVRLHTEDEIHVIKLVK